MKFVLIGKHLAHSFSKKYFDNFFEEQKIDASYDLMEMEDCKNLRTIIKDKKINGLNVTIPFKEHVIPLLNTCDEDAISIGAVNCIVVEHKQSEISLHGHNTDIIGFEKSIENIAIKNKKALILGTGGSSKAVQYVFTKLNIPFSVVSRSKPDHLKYDKLNDRLIKEHELIINCTPLGMHPKMRARPELNYSAIGSEHILIDLIYNPSMTWFLRSGLEQGASCINGYQMLTEQAIASWKLWNTKA